MHEIPNFPPGQQEPQQSALAQQEMGQTDSLDAAVPAEQEPASKP